MTLINMEKKKYIHPTITVYNITPSVILAGSIRYASEEDYGGLTGEYYGDSHHPDMGDWITETPQGVIQTLATVPMQTPVANVRRKCPPL